VEKDEGALQSSGGSCMSPQSERVILEVLILEMERCTRNMESFLQEAVSSGKDPYGEEWGVQIQNAARIHAALAEFRQVVKGEDRPQ